MKRLKQCCIYGLIWSMASWIHVIGVPNFLQSPGVLFAAVTIFYCGYLTFDRFWEDK